MRQTDKPSVAGQNIDQMNEVIASYDGWKEWEYEKGLWFHPERNKQAQEFEYHSDWNLLHGAWDKLYATRKALKPLDPIRRSFYLLFCKPMSAAMYCGEITTAHRIFFDAVEWYNNQNK